MCYLLFVFALLICILLLEHCGSGAARDCCWVISTKLCEERAGRSGEAPSEVLAFGWLLPEKHLFVMCHLNKQPNWK